MKVRDVYLAQNQTLQDSQTFTLPIPNNLKIQFIRLRYTNTNGATSNTVGKLNGMVTKLQLADGSNVINSLSMQENQALHYYQNGVFPFKQLSEQASGVVIEEAVMNFGRFLGDPQFYLDTSRFNNPQLNLTHAFTVSGTGGFTTGKGQLSIIARVIDDQAPAYQGYICSKEQNSFVTAASGYAPPIYLPQDFDYASLMVGALLSGNAPDAVLIELDLLINSQQFVPFQFLSSDMLAENAAFRPPITEDVLDVVGGTAGAWNSDLFSHTGAYASEPGSTSLAVVTNLTADQVAWVKTTGGVTLVQISVKGYSPFSTFYHGFGMKGDPGDFLHVQGLSQIQLNLKQGVAGAAATVVSSQLRN